MVDAPDNALSGLEALEQNCINWKDHDGDAPADETCKQNKESNVTIKCKGHYIYLSNKQREHDGTKDS